jgi:hypothetical protein
MELVAPGKRILVIGALNVNPADRVLERDQLHSMQLIDEKNAVTPVTFFDAWGEMGMSSMCQHPRDPYTLYIASDSEVFKFCLSNKTYERLDIADLADIHEISIIGDKVWITNTRHDQIVGYDMLTGTVSDRINLDVFRAGAPEVGERDPHATVLDRFHCNQVFQGYEGGLKILAHALSGRQFAKRVGKVEIKISAYDGGVADLTRRQRHRLHLRSPHSVRLINDNYWVFDSARFMLSVFDRQWKLIRSMETRGFGRGGDRDTERGIYYAGVSATRKRYLGLLPGGDGAPNMVQAFDTNSYTELGSVRIPNIEQILNVYCLDRHVADALLNLGG